MHLMQSALQWREVGMHQRQAENSNGRQASSATQCNTLQHIARQCRTVQGSATHCNTLQHSATHGKAVQNSARQCTARRRAGGSIAIDRVTRRGNPNTIATHLLLKFSTLPRTKLYQVCIGSLEDKLDLTWKFLVWFAWL